MKNLTIYLFGAVILLITACEKNDNTQKNKENSFDDEINYGSQAEFKSSTQTYTFGSRI